MRALIVAAALLAILLIGFGGWWMYWPHQMGGTNGGMMHGGMASVDSSSSGLIVPELSARAKTGQKRFEENCIVCHGVNAGGTDQGPPLVHRIYEPNHHGDRAFYLAAQQGVRAHHWRFGDMPPITAVSQRDVKAIIAYVRELQRANGIN